MDELLLQADGVGRDDHPGLVTQCKFSGGQKIRHALAHPGASLDDQVFLVGERLRNTLKHGFLLSTVLKARYNAFKRAARADKGACHLLR